MTFRPSVLELLVCGMLGMPLAATTASAQSLGTFRWQLAPFCNVVTVNVMQTNGMFTLDGFDDQCGAATRAAVVGTAFPNPDGSIGIGLSIVATPGAAPVHVDVALSLASVGGPWRDSAGNSGTFLFNPALPAPGSSRPPTGGLISTVTPGAGLTGGGTAGAVTLAVAYGGSGAAATAAHSDHTHAAAGTGNTAVGAGALTANSSGSASNNTAVGSGAMSDKQSGNNNVAIGSRALGDDVAGSANVAIGRSALASADGDLNTAVGYSTLSNLTTGTRNTALGANAGTDLNTGSNNIYLGAEGDASESGTVRIGQILLHTRVFITGIRNVTTGLNNAVPALIDSNGQLGMTNSTRRVKQDIVDLHAIGSDVQRLRPVEFRYTQAFTDGSKPIQYGLIAEEVEEVLPELVAYDGDGQPASVKYHVLPTLLLAEVQRLERERAAQTGAIEELRKEVRALRDERR